MTPTRPAARLSAHPALARLAAAATMFVALAAMSGPAIGGEAPAGRPAAGMAGPIGLPGRSAAGLPGRVVPLWLLRGAGPGRWPGQRAAPDSLSQPGGYDPAELRAYLRLRGTGTGQTVAVTEAFDMKPSVLAALARYDRWYHLPPPCPAGGAAGCFSLRFAAPYGTSDTSASVFGWTVEADLDVELIHALAPRASIVVVEARDDAVVSMLAAVGYAQHLHPAVISDSWSTSEFAGERALDSRCPATGPVCVFSSGDGGNYAGCTVQGGGAGCGGYPAASPGVLAVGGTTLDLAPGGTVRSETAWSGSGGGISRYEPRPGYQQPADRWPGGRGIPDVSFDASPASGVAMYNALIAYYRGRWYDLCAMPGTHSCGWQEAGGTSVGAPAWAAILAAADQLRAAAGLPPLTPAGVHAAVYAARSPKPVADISAGANGICGPRCTAGPGYDLVTGEGSPRPGIDAYLARY